MADKWYSTRWNPMIGGRHDNIPAMGEDSRDGEYVRFDEAEAAVAELRARCEKAEAALAGAKASRDLQARIASDEEEFSRAAESRCAELALRIAETRAAALEEAASLIERDIFDSSVRLDPSKHKNLSDWIRAQQAAAIRALIPREEGSDG